MKSAVHKRDSSADQKALYRFILDGDPRKKKKLLNYIAVRTKLLWKALLSVIFQQRGLIEPVVCDVLLIHPSQKSFLQGRKKPLIAALKARGLNVEEYVEIDDRDLILHRSFYSPCRSVPFLFRWHAAHAEYLLRRFETKVMLTERNGWVLPSFIKMLRRDGAIVVHLAHSVITSQSSRYRYFDYDYYFLYGRSSLEYLKRLPNTFGQCVACYCGPYFWADKDNFSKPTVPSENIECLFLAPGPAYETRCGYLEVCSWVMEWLAENESIHLSVKLHPRGAGNWWRSHLVDNERISIVPEHTSLDDCAARFDIVLSDYTNAIVDVARYATPFVLLGSNKDYFSVERFGIPRARSAIQLRDEVDAILADPSAYAARSLSFFEFHVENRRFPLGSIVDSVVSLANKKALPGIRLKSALDDFDDA
ncbi:hypothetical protein U8L64_17255 [Pseudomonas sp. FIP_A4]|jgi:hypothetical protein|uniref:hypothetical protein n=1 Tax=Pseudomonas sp. FIP_A4 TaxID=3070684 RepID=UPI002893F0FB|nr:hypothetical protein [Pseudomonadaceae bacterium]